MTIILQSYKIYGGVVKSKPTTVEKWNGGSGLLHGYRPVPGEVMGSRDAAKRFLLSLSLPRKDGEEELVYRLYLWGGRLPYLNLFPGKMKGRVLPLNPFGKLDKGGG